MIEDAFSVKMDILKLYEEWKQRVTYKPAPDKFFNHRVIRMYLEPDQKMVIAKEMNLKPEMVSDFIELDPDVKEQYEAMYKSGLILRKAIDHE